MVLWKGLYAAKTAFPALLGNVYLYNWLMLKATHLKISAVRNSIHNLVKLLFQNLSVQSSYLYSFLELFFKIVVLIMFPQQNNYIINIEVIINENIGIIDEKKLTKFSKNRRNFIKNLLKFWNKFEDIKKEW